MMVEVIVKEERDDGRMVERDAPHASRAQGPADLPISPMGYSTITGLQAISSILGTYF